MDDDSPYPPDDDESAAKRFVWDTDDAISYEIALDLIIQVIGHCSSTIASERAKLNPDPNVIANLQAQRLRLVRERQSLRPDDHAEVARVTVEYGTLLRRAHRHEG